MIQDVFISGATGKVGRTLIKQIFEKGDTDKKRHINTTRIIGLASSNDLIYSAEGISKVEAEDFSERKLSNSTKYKELHEILDTAKQRIKQENSSLVFVDVTSLNEPMTDFHLRVIEETPYSIATANKNPIALSSYSVFQRLTHDVKRYGYRCSVMAGAHAVPLLQELRDVNDGILLLQGCFSGTLGYISSELEKGRKFSDILKESYAMGYTEPHPRDDLNGLDVARKLVVLARTAGYSVEMKDVQLEPFIPKEFLLEDDVSTFLESVKSVDKKLNERMSKALNDGNTLRYVACMDTRDNKIELQISLAEVPRISHFGSLHGTLNKLVVVTKTHPEDKPYQLISQGAGLEVTAQNIRGDLLYLLPERKNILQSSNKL